MLDPVPRGAGEVARAGGHRGSTRRRSRRPERREEWTVKEVPVIRGGVIHMENRRGHPHRPRCGTPNAG